MKRRIIGYMCAAVLLAGILYSPSLAAYAEAQEEPVKTEENLNKPEENDQNSFHQEEDLLIQQEKEDNTQMEADILTEDTIYEEVSEGTRASEAAPASDGKKFYNLTFLTLQDGGEVIKTIQVEAGTICAKAEGFIPSKEVLGNYTSINYQWRKAGGTMMVGPNREMPEEDLAVYVYPAAEAKNWEKQEKDGKTFWVYTASSPNIEIECDSHNWDQGIVTKEPTCTEAGTKRYTCTDEGCSETKTESIPAKGHTAQSTGNKSATCTEDGYTGKTVCSVCGVTVQEGTVESATGHTYNDQNVCETCGTVQYEVIGSKSLTYTLKGTTGINLRVNAARKDEDKNGFKLQMDGQEVDAEGHYEVSTEGWFWTIELEAEYLNTLSVGRHIITLHFVDGKETTVNLVVNNAASGTASGDTGGAGNKGNQNTSSSSNKSSGHSNSTSTPAVVVNAGSPQTGDTSNMLLWAVLMLLSASGAAFCIAKKNKAI